MTLPVQKSLVSRRWEIGDFFFCGRRRDRIKALHWENNGFVLQYKRLESDIFQ